MLVQQGALNFTSWTGVEAPVDVMYKTLEAEFGA
jgi:shikimate dehydrogenase